MGEERGCRICPKLSVGWVEGWASEFLQGEAWPQLWSVDTVVIKECKFLCLTHSEAKQTETSYWSLEQRKFYCRAMQEEWVAHTPKTPNSSKGFSKALLKARWGKGVVHCCKLPGAGILCSCRCPSRSGHSVPINLQQDKCYSLFCNFLSLYEWKRVIPLKVKALRMAYPVYFRL